MQLIEVEECRGFYLVPGYDRLAINRKGMVYDLSMKYCYIPLSNYEYLAINVFGLGTIHIHRLLALTFIPTEVDPDTLQVNHKDGIKHNNTITNLEWVTVSGNAIHAYVTGLRPDNKPVLIKDLRTGKVVRHYSLNECARRLGVNPEKVSRYLKGRELYPFLEYFEIIFEGQAWRGLTENDIGKVRPGRPKAVVVIKEKTATIYRSIEIASRDLKISAYRLTRMLNDRTKPSDLTVLYSSDFDGNVDNMVFMGDEPTMKIPRRKPIPVTVFDTTTRETTSWESVEAFGFVIGMSKNTIQKSMFKNNGRWRHYILTYQSPSTPKRVDDSLLIAGNSR